MLLRTTVGCGFFLTVAGVALATPDTRVPTSLRMRSRVVTPGSPHRASRQLAQAPAPDPLPPDYSPDDHASDPPGSVPAPSARPAPPRATGATAAAGPSDAELEKLADQSEPDEIIFITGSTIGRKTVTTPAPVTLVDRELLAASGVSTVGDSLQQLPAQVTSASSQVNFGGDGTTRVDLRGLGVFRTLTLINGRRVVPVGLGADVSADLNMIPLAMVDRVEILKDGASAVYGSDAIGGVVNVITRSDFVGSEAALYTGGSSHGDAFTYDASLVTGYSSADKNSRFVFSAGVQEQRPVLAGDRTFSATDKAYDYGRGIMIPGASTVAPAGRINSNAIDTNGDGRPDPVDLCGAQYCTSNGANGYRPFGVADLYNAQPISYLYTPSSRYHVYSVGSYKLGSQTELFFEASYAKRNSAQQVAPESFFGTAPISKDSMYNSVGGTVLDYQRRLVEFGPRRQLESVDAFRIVGGLMGTLPSSIKPFEDFKWELSYNYGRSNATTTAEGSLVQSRLAAALGPSFMSSNGVPTCGTSSNPIPGCVPMNILGPAGSIDPAAASYVTFAAMANGFNDQQSVLGQAHGQLAKLPNNGDLSLAVGGDVRRESGGFVPDGLTGSGDTTWVAAAPTAGSYTVLEAFGELSLVPISGKPLARWFELNLAARAFRYDTFGAGVTWKAGGLYRIVDSFAVRGTYSTAFRAPSVGELYQGAISLFLPATDPCDTRPAGMTITLDPDVAAECARQGVPAVSAFGSPVARHLITGNPKLEAETANVVTAGIVFEPPIKGVSITADYWQTNIANAIQRLTAPSIFTNCYLHHVQSSCALVHRNPAFGYAIDHVDIVQQNVGGAFYSGIDLALVLDRRVAGAGRFRTQLESQYLLQADLDDTVRLVHGLNNNDLGPRPQVRMTLTSVWEHPGGLGGGLNLRYIGSFKECEQSACSSGAPSRDVPRWYDLGLFASYALRSRMGKTAVTVGVNNVVDASPPAIYGGIGYDPGYDFKGRFFYTRVSQQF
jgi:iron complex outermembrane receptor protein